MHDITKRWPKQQDFVLNRVGLSLDPGDVVWVGGQNGAGKTTLLRIAAGMIKPDTGSVSVHGLEPRRDRREFQRSVGFLSAGNTGIYARLSIRRHLDYWSRLSFVPESERKETIARAIDRFSLEELASRRGDRLSLGQRQRLRIAMTFLHDPKLALLDEPVNSLDDNGKELLATTVKDFTAGGGSVVWCAPSTEGIGLPCEQAYVVEAGRLVPS